MESVNDEKPMLDKVNSAIGIALDKAGIELPFETYNVTLETNMDDCRHVNQ